MHTQPSLSHLVRGDLGPFLLKILAGLRRKDRTLSSMIEALPCARDRPSGFP